MKCFLCHSEVLPTLNTFIMLDIIIQMLKGSNFQGRSKGKREKKKKKKKKTKKKALYLTNRIMMEAFPPNFKFILAFLNGQVDHHAGGTLPEERAGNGELHQLNEDKHDDELQAERNSFLRNTAQWNVHKVKDIKKGTLERVNHFEPPMKEHLSMDKFKQILEHIHIKYIERGNKQQEEDDDANDKERTLTEALYNLNEQKEYNWVIVNLAFLFLEDKKKINMYAENLCLHYCHEQTKDTCTDSLNNTKEIHFSPRNKNNFANMLMEREIYDVTFFKNILSFHFCYSFLVNFDEHLNHNRVAVTISHAIHSQVGGLYKDAQRGGDCFGDGGRGERARGRRTTHRTRGRDNNHDPEPTDRWPNNEQHTVATRLDQNNAEKNSSSRKRKLGEIEGAEVHSGGYSGASAAERERSAPEEGSTTDTAPSGGSDEARHTHVEHPNLNDLPNLCNDDPRREHVTKNGNTHAKDFLTHPKRKKKKGKRKHLYTFDVVPKCDVYKKNYLNMLSLYCDCVFLIS
ncbi:hypothetical protein AK88_00052 [Plasmodium fragile]|uniref:Uncharacterized protein n=1 Tax=Plasmodium fragile TaxID=5857 RepID=A0A0D9QT32_PLAFR|nr:uncharacterized protein AK88_00052 [Plasmodium fragile]KJP90204.1 hypothetical protein AK88_00052 [Plasmodium fragile]